MTHGIAVFLTKSDRGPAAVTADTAVATRVG